MYTCMNVLLQDTSPLVKSQSSDTDSEEEHDIDPSIHDSPMYNSSLISCHSNKEDKEDHVDDKENDMFVTASGRFIAPTSTLPRMRRSMTMAGKSPYSLESILDSPSALARKRFRLLYDSFELISDDDMEQGSGEEKDEYCLDDSGVMLHSQEAPSSLPSSPFRVSDYHIGDQLCEGHVSMQIFANF